jgi:hypothetical protein
MLDHASTLTDDQPRCAARNPVPGHRPTRRRSGRGDPGWSADRTCGMLPWPANLRLRHPAVQGDRFGTQVAGPSRPSLAPYVRDLPGTTGSTRARRRQPAAVRVHCRGDDRARHIFWVTCGIFARRPVSAEAAARRSRGPSTWARSEGLETPAFRSVVPRAGTRTRSDRSVTSDEAPARCSRESRPCVIDCAGQGRRGALLLLIGRQIVCAGLQGCGHGRPEMGDGQQAVRPGVAARPAPGVTMGQHGSAPG